MTPSNLTFSINESKVVPFALSKLESTLSYSKEDVELYFFMLAVISEKHPEIAKRNESFNFLIKQDKLQKILNDLIARHQALVTESNTILAFDYISVEKTLQSIQQLEQELDIFNELHFKVKRTYIRFANEHFQAGWGQSFMVA